MKRFLIIAIFCLIPFLAYGQMLAIIGGEKANAISLTTPSAMNVGDADQTITCTTLSGDSCTVTSNTTGYCTIVSSKLHAVAAGTCTITANDAGSMGWGPAISVTSENVTISAGCNCTVGAGSQWVQTAENDWFNIDGTYGHNYQQVVISSGTYNICQVDTKVFTDSGTDTMQVKICSDSGCSSNCTSTVNATPAVSSVEAWITATFSTPYVATTTFYVCMINSTGAHAMRPPLAWVTAFGGGTSNYSNAPKGYPMTMKLYYCQ